VSYEASAIMITSLMAALVGKQFARVGVPVTIAGYALMLLFAVTYWRWLGWT